MYQFIAYIKFLFKATNQHGVHSPFVYNFVTKCLYDTTHFSAYQRMQGYRTDLLKSKTRLEVFDLGEGSKSLSKHKRKVSNMARTSSSSQKTTRVLHRAIRYFNAKTILELGTSLGMATYAMALANRTAKMITIEGCPNTSNVASSKFNNLDISNTEFKKGEFSALIPTLKDAHYDFIFFDGHHNKDATINYFETLLPKAHNETVFVFDDIYWSQGMTEAWQYIKAHPAVTVTVDCFYLGFVFFRKEQAKEHFRIRM